MKKVKRIALVSLLAASGLLISTAMAGKRIRNDPRDGTVAAGMPESSPRSCPSGLVAGSHEGRRSIKAVVPMDAAKALGMLAEAGDLNAATAAPLLLSSLGYARGSAPGILYVTIEVRGDVLAEASPDTP